jgi:hypothetical protein
MAARCSQCSDSVLGPVGTFVFVFGWVGYQGSRATRRWWFDRGRAGGEDISIRPWWVVILSGESLHASLCMPNNNQQDPSHYIRGWAEMIGARARSSSSRVHHRPSAYDNSPAAAEGV